MEESILLSIKKRLGIGADYTPFEEELISDINSVLSELWLLGLNSADEFKITGTKETWTDLFGEYRNLEYLKDYVKNCVRKKFDPPSSSIHMQALDDEIKRLEWKINVMCDDWKGLN